MFGKLLELKIRFNVIKLLNEFVWVSLESYCLTNNTVNKEKLKLNLQSIVLS